ncbi:hypothetical protein [Streptomyces sp. NPDC003943]
MTKTRTFRWLKGTLVSGLAALVGYAVWHALRQWAHAASAGPDAGFGTGFLESLVASVVGVLLTPLLLWAGMRLTGERGNHLLVAGGAAAWFFAGGRLVENAGVDTVELALTVVLFAVLGGLLSLVEVPRK